MRTESVSSAWLTVGTTTVAAATIEASAESVFNMVISLFASRAAGDLEGSPRRRVDMRYRCCRVARASMARQM